MTRIIEIDPTAGFCFGVEKAIEIAEANLARGETVFGLGEMVHNHHEINRLEKRGLKTIRVEDFSRIAPAKVILRAHGEPPATYQTAAENGVEIIDATCPIVLKLQQKIRKVFLEMDHDSEQIVIYGKEGHAETIGLMGQTEGSAVLVTNPDELNFVDKDKSIFLFSQTTMDPDEFQRVEDNLLELTNILGKTTLHSDCSICNQMKRRKPNLKKFAKRNQVVLFVSGKGSSNGKMLFDYCKTQNSNAFWISSPGEIQREWLEGTGNIGISGATSTPNWQLKETRDHVRKLIDE